MQARVVVDLIKSGPDNNPSLWEQIKAGYADKDACKDNAYLIDKTSCIAEIQRFELSSPTTVDRVHILTNVVGLSTEIACRYTHC